MKGWIEIHDDEGATCVQVAHIDGFFVSKNGTTIIKGAGAAGSWEANETYDEVKALIAKSMNEDVPPVSGAEGCCSTAAVRC